MLSLIFGCSKDDYPDVTSLDETSTLPVLTLTKDGPYESSLPKGCDCYYQILSVDANPAPGGGNPNGGPDYYFHGGPPVGINNTAGFCAGTSNNCMPSEPCYGFSAYGSVNSSGCQCFDPINCEDFIFDDLDLLNGSPYPTQFFPFNCGIPLFSDLIVEWECLWYSPDCTGQYTVGTPSSLTFRVMCIDPEPLPDGCEILGQANVSPPITLQMTGLSQLFTSTIVELIDCGCTPVEK